MRLLLAQINDLEHRIAISIGETIETDNLRIHRYSISVEVVDLKNAGKRGQMVDMFSVDTDKVPFDLLKKIEQSKNYEEALSLVKQFKPYERKVKGIEVAPAGFKPLYVQGQKVSIQADYKNFSVRDHSDINEMTCIPAIRGGKADIKVFYRWVSDNQDKIKSMTFSDVVKAMRDNGISYHSYCALD
jgi:hypothetical protein